EVMVGTTSSLHLKRNDIPQLRRRLGVVFQDFRLLETRTAAQNVAFALEVTGTPRSAIPARVDRVLQQVGLSSKATAYPNELCGGEQQRVTWCLPARRSPPESMRSSAPRHPVCARHAGGIVPGCRGWPGPLGWWPSSPPARPPPRPAPHAFPRACPML